ncbi:MAG TPA: c-type cytochrome [Polyangiaceae bacterium]|nr:c-type cytochrome [Polyangiaceae bacterium]
MSRSETGLFLGVALGVALGGCNSFDKRPDDANEPRLVIPLDERAAVTAPTTPPPISGGTLSVLSDSSAAIVADPERDRVSIVDLNTRSLRATVALQPGDEPGRSVEDNQRHVHVALRRGGAIVAIDPSTGSLLSRRAVCKAPRGLAFDAASGLLHVACAEGKLVSLPAQGGDAVRTLDLGPDLRDVLVRGSELWVTRFKTAEVLRLSSVGTVASSLKIPNIAGQLSQPSKSQNSSELTPQGLDLRNVNLEAGVAWRAVSSASGGAVIVHQGAVTDDIPITPPSASGGSAYGGDGFGCSGIVKNVVSTVGPDGSVVSTQFSGPPLAVDLAVSPDKQWLAVAHAGLLDSSAPRPTLVFPGHGGDSAPTATGPGAAISPSVAVLPTSGMVKGGGDPNCAFPQGVMTNAPATAVAFAPNGVLVAQTRDPAQLLIQRDLPFGQQDAVPLLGESRADTGHDLFHRDAGGGIACASCHPEGGEDGHTWHFTDTGERRTQALHVGLRDTAPFHWNGDLPNVGAVMSEVFVGRMGGVRESDSRVSAVSEWLFSLKAPAPIREANDEAAQRGQALFQSTEVGCTTCHSGPKLTDNRSMAVDSVLNKKLQVPSLVGIAYRAPFMHNGCAATLAARFDPKCGGDQHGNVAQLSDAQRSDLVAYLETL